MIKIYKKYLSDKFRLQIHYLFYKVRAIFFLGNNFYCNCCKKNFRAFLSKGNIKRENAECPYCGSLERNRLLMLYFEHHPEILKGEKSLLHFAPEYCLKRLFLKMENLSYTDVDLNPDFATYQVDITQIPHKDNAFDLIICSHVLGHVPDEHKGITEMFRVLKPGGKAFLMTLINNNNVTYEDSKNNSPELKLKYYGESDLCRLHGTDFKERIEKGGFQVEVINYSKQLDLAINRKLSLGNGERELIFLSTKD